VSDCCNDHCHSQPPVNPRFRRALWIALAVNAAMFVVEIIGGFGAHSASLLADAVDFFGDAANYAVSLFVLGLAPVWRSRTALLKGFTMGGYGLFVLGRVIWQYQQGTLPAADVMGAIGIIALFANAGVAWLLYAFREGDANMRSVWLCSRNDAIGNAAVILAAMGVAAYSSNWPDLLVALVMAVLGLQAAVHVIRQARQELDGDNTR
jgi:Co/Zn/Cd efflux system component